MHKLIRKIRFTFAIAAFGADWSSRLTLFLEMVRIQARQYLPKLTDHPFEARLGTKSRNALLRFFGTVDEMHALNEIFAERCYDPRTGAPVRAILDLGANSGLAAAWFWLSFPGARIDAYEANPRIFGRLTENVGALENVQLFNVAIAGTSGTLPFHVAARSFSSSLCDLPSSETIEVPAKTLDEAIATIGGAVDLAKLDIEGAEFEALAAARRLSDVATIIGEAHPEKAGRDDATELMRTLGKTHRIDGALGDAKSLFVAVRK